MGFYGSIKHLGVKGWLVPFELIGKKNLDITVGDMFMVKCELLIKLGETCQELSVVIVDGILESSSNDVMRSTGSPPTLCFLPKLMGLKQLATTAQLNNA